MVSFDKFYFYFVFNLFFSLIRFILLSLRIVFFFLQQWSITVWWIYKWTISIWVATQLWLIVFRPSYAIILMLLVKRDLIFSSFIFFLLLLLLLYSGDSGNVFYVVGVHTAQLLHQTSSKKHYCTRIRA